ncbi:ABC transporter substrate-binding protein [Corynebacterium casei]|uniref:ABC transporter substrate-binding protein n=1 Tax=Corynebacterium casei TaxID=160386 RepID=UPI0026473AD0|nr:ABC transporter substrate-binding protein [Corynebacterium casei]MDN6313285.1 ABC transporter substrate-binding protein [Corynebacterium casei]
MASLALAGTAACSSEDGEPATETAETSAAEAGEDSGDAETSEASENITVSHAYGETEVPLNPESIATLDGTWSNALGELGVDITMALTVSQLEDGGPWADYAAENTASYDTAAGESILANIEKIAAQKPDVILAGYLPDQDAYDKLSEIAPTVGVVGGGLVNDWREATLLAGQITDRESEAQAAIDEVDAQIEAVREAHPGLEGATGTFVQISPQGFAVVTEDTDPANEFLSDLGVIVPAEIKEAGQDGGRAFISEENVGIFNTDAQGWNELEPVKNDTVFSADFITANAIGTPTVQSVPWALVQLEPTLQRLDEVRS